MTRAICHYINVHWESKNQLFGQWQSELLQLHCNSAASVLFWFQYGKGKGMIAVPFNTNVDCECEGEALHVQCERPGWGRDESVRCEGQKLKPVNSSNRSRRSPTGSIVKLIQKNFNIFFGKFHTIQLLNSSISSFLTRVCVSELRIAVCDQIIKSRYVPNKRRLTGLLHNIRYKRQKYHVLELKFYKIYFY